MDRTRNAARLKGIKSAMNAHSKNSTCYWIRFLKKCQNTTKKNTGQVDFDMSRPAPAATLQMVKKDYKEKKNPIESCNEF